MDQLEIGSGDRRLGGGLAAAQIEVAALQPIEFG